MQAMVKRGQLKIQQMMMMLLAVTLFFVLAGLFILSTQLSSINQKSNLIKSDNAKLLASKIADSPEFSCGDSFGTGMSSCIDADKVINLKTNINEYKNFWGVQGLQIRTVYPQGNGTECNIGNFPNCDTITLIPSSNGTGVSNFVSLCGYYFENGQSNIKCNLAEIIVTYTATS